MSIQSSEPLVSVVMPTYNRANLIVRAIESVLHQAHENIELLVVDDASSDDTARVMSRYANNTRVKYIRRETNGGAAATRNTGLRAAAGEFVAFHDDDDEWLYDRLSSQLKYFAVDKNLALTSCAMVRYNSHDDQFVFPPKALSLAADARRALAGHFFAFTQTWLARRDCLVALGGFDETLRVWDDWDLMFRVSQAYTVEYTPELGVISHPSPQGIGADVSRRVHDLQIFVDKFRPQGDSHLMSNLHYMLGRFLATQGDWVAASAQGCRALRCDPMRARHWALVVGAPLLSALFQRRWRKRQS